MFETINLFFDKKYQSWLLGIEHTKYREHIIQQSSWDKLLIAATLA
jgi:hypothetical protein